MAVCEQETSAMKTTRARAAGLFGILVIAITWIVWYPSTLSGTRYLGLEVHGSNPGAAAGGFEQVPPATTPAPARDSGPLRPHLQDDGSGQPPAPRAAADYGGIRPHFQGYGTGQPAATPLLTYNVAGRGGRIFRVDTLADNRDAPVALADGTYRSSLRAAVEAEGPRVVIFETSGVMCLSEALVVYEPFLTIAGQTAPSPGINVRCAPFKVDTHDVLVQHIRFRYDRLGYPGSQDTWPVQIVSTYNWTYNVVLDHVSVAFANGYMSIAMGGHLAPWDVAVLDSLIAWPLATGITAPGYELTGYGLRYWAVSNGQNSAARNLFVHSSHRNLSGQGGRLNWVNNAILGSGPDDGYTTLSFQGVEFTANDSDPRYRLLGVAVNNQFLPSIGTGSGLTAGTLPEHRTFDFWFLPENVQRGDSVYLAGNLGPFVTGPTGQGQWSGVHFEGGVGWEILTEAVPEWHAAQQFELIPTEVLSSTLERTAGARPADRDSVDALAIEHLRAAMAGDNARIGSRISAPEDLQLDLTLPRNLRQLDVPANPNEVVDAAGRTRLEVWLEEHAQAVEGTGFISDIRVQLTANRPAPQPAGTATTFTATATGEGPFQYKWWVYDGAVWTIVQDWSTSNTFTWQPATANAAYIVGVWVRNASTTTDTEEASAVLPFAITGSASLQVALTADRQAPQMAGATITFTAAATAGLGPYQYKWWVYDGALWTIVRDWSTASTFTWHPATANASYEVAVWARSATTTTDTEEASARLPFAITPSIPLQVRLTANRLAPQPAGTEITFTAAASGGEASYQYKWWIYDGALWRVVQDWSAANGRFTWNPATANAAYQVAVWVRNASTTTDTEEASALLPFAITAPEPLRVGLTANRQPPQPTGTVITFTAAATGGQAPHQYKWWVYDGALWRVVQDWGASHTFAWQPAAANAAYQVAVWARSATTTTDTEEASAVLPFVITAPGPLQVELTANRPPPQPAGTPITFAAAATGGQAPHQYKWWVFDGVLWRVVQDWSASSTFTWYPASANAAYVIAVWARSATTTTDTEEASAVLPFAITAPAPLQVALTANLPPPQMAGTVITFTAAATGGQAPHQYKWRVFDGVLWRVVQDWSASSTFTWQPATANAAYRIGVWVRNASTTTDTPEASAEFPFEVTPAS
jgi:hypothetical protein